MTNADNDHDQHDESGYRKMVAALVHSHINGDSEQVSHLFSQLCDDPAFDTTLAAVVSAIDHADFDPLGFRYDMLAMSPITLVPYKSTKGKAHAIVQLFFLPLSGVLTDIEAVSNDTDKLTKIASSYPESGLASRHSSIVACGSLLDPISASTVTPGAMRAALKMTAPVLTGRIAGSNLGEALAYIFGSSSRPETLSVTNNQVYAHRLMPIARIVTPSNGVHVDDALTSYKIDVNATDRQRITDWRRGLQTTIPNTVMVGNPCSIMRGCTVMAINTIEHAFSRRAMYLGHSTMPQFDEVGIKRKDDDVLITARHGNKIYGPVTLPIGLFFADPERITSFVDGLSRNVGWSEEPVTLTGPGKPH